MCAAQLHSGALHNPWSCSSRRTASHRPRVVGCRPATAARPLPRLAANWKVFGPTAEYSDGDAEFYNTTARLADQYEWFAPGRESSGDEEQQAEEQQREEAEFGLTPRQIAALGLSGPRTSLPNPATLSSKTYLRGEKFDPASFSFASASSAAAAGAPTSTSAATAVSPHRVPPTMAGRRGASGPRAAYGDYPSMPEGRPVFLPEAERFGNPPDLPSLLLQQRIIYISMPFLPSVTELVVAQCYYLDFDDKNRQKPIYVYLNSTGCINDKNQAISADNEFYAIWAALGFTRAPLYTGVTWKAQNQAAVLLAAGQKGHRYSFPHAKISTSPPILNRVFGQASDAQLQSNELEYATKYYAAILARATGKDLATCQKEYLSRKRYFSVKEAYEEGLIDKLVPGYKLNRFRKIVKDTYGDTAALFGGSSRPKFRFTRKDEGASS